MKLLLSVAYTFLGAWIAMLAIGASHHFDARVPAFGYWTVFWLAFAIGTITYQIDAAHND